MVGKYTDLKDMPPAIDALSYDTTIPSKGAIAFVDEPQIPWDIMFPDAAAQRADKAPAQAYRSFQQSSYVPDRGEPQVGPTSYQIADDQWYEGIDNYLKMITDFRGGR